MDKSADAASIISSSNSSNTPPFAWLGTPILQRMKLRSSIVQPNKSTICSCWRPSTAADTDDELNCEKKKLNNNDDFIRTPLPRRTELYLTPPLSHCTPVHRYKRFSFVLPPLANCDSDTEGSVTSPLTSGPRTSSRPKIDMNQLLSYECEPKPINERVLNGRMYCVDEFTANTTPSLSYVTMDSVVENIREIDFEVRHLLLYSFVTSHFFFNLAI
jgi:hypothetical protein